MRVFVDWDTDGYSVEELGLPTIVDMPTLNINDIADYLSDNYSYCVSSFKIIELDSGAWHGNDAWVLYDDGHELTVLIGGHTFEEALRVKELSDNDWDTSEYDDYLVWTDAEEWVEQQEFA